ncbi:MAG: tRNA (adenosine(37)-N6)-threonylcarbamoyltransferase complex ATPase subunit type 1 TsaE [Dissulfurimicrobium sp.]|uniref:tRNA (adenosine(37)-N6)-threonylcarbamoyltransferase complex ATPase subunit type 1 TsaE n=1 Tax=Dissulfurimicrobium hydrothermale TaxID=1750598 RepID=UPI003C71FE02
MRSSSLKETRLLGRCLAKLLFPGDVVLLSGDLGAGKTTLVKAVCSGLGMDERQVTSPTFAIIHEYRAAMPPVCHADLYRLGPDVDAGKIGLLEYLGGEWVVMIEWGEFLDDAARGNVLKIDMRWRNETARDVAIDGFGTGWLERLSTLDACLKETNVMDALETREKG